MWHLLLLFPLMCLWADQTETEKGKMLVLYKTARIALSQHGLVELSEMMGTSYIYVVQFYSHWLHVELST